MEQLLYPIGRQSFKSLREDGFVYIDKTDLIYKLIREGKFYFLSRPRRFGKSLLLSTIEAYFKGERELFKGLAIDKLTDKWDRHEVIHLDLNNTEYTAPHHLKEFIEHSLTEWEKEYGKDPSEKSVGMRFAGIIKRAYEKSRLGVVVLVDEYDKPLTEAILDEELSAAYRETLKSLYSNFKTCDQYLKFVMLTGVSRFAGVSVFTGNNLEDISNDEAYETLCGITEREMTDHLGIGIKALAEKHSISEEEAIALLKKWYDGYQFSERHCDVYNPFSLLNALKKSKLGIYWYNTGTPSFLYKLLLNERIPMSRLLNISDYPKDVLSIMSGGAEDPVSLMLQTGYLTINTWTLDGECTLRFPNHEVKESFLKYLLNKAI